MSAWSDIEFQWDPRNPGHAAEHDVTPRLVRDVANNEPLLFENAARPGRSGSHVMIGPDTYGRFWTIIMRELPDDLWRPITGWPSTNTELRLYRGEGD